jgi:hypothetical protein
MTELIVTFDNFVNTPEGAIEKNVIAEICEFNYLGCGARGSVVVKALPYKPAGLGFDSR